MLEAVQNYPLYTFLYSDSFLSEKDNCDYAAAETLVSFALAVMPHVQHDGTHVIHTGMELWAQVML